MFETSLCKFGLTDSNLVTSMSISKNKKFDMLVSGINKSKVFLFFSQVFIDSKNEFLLIANIKGTLLV